MPVCRSTIQHNTHILAQCSGSSSEYCSFLSRKEVAVASSSAAFPASCSSWAVDGNTVACRTRERVYAIHVMIHIIFPCASPWLADVFFVFIAVNFAQCISNQTTRSAPLWKCMVFCHYSCLFLILVFFVFFILLFCSLYALAQNCLLVFSFFLARTSSEYV